MSSTSPLIGARAGEYDPNWALPNDYYETFHEEDFYDEEATDEDSDDDDAMWRREERLKNQEIHWLKRPSVFMVGLIMFLFSFALSSSAASHKIIEVKLSCNYLSRTSSDGMCGPVQVQLVISNLQMAYGILGNIVMLVGSGKVSALSDRYGRKVFIVGAISTMVLGRLVKLYIMTRWDTLHFGLMVFSEVLSNVGGGGISLVALLNCYLADVVDPRKRIYYMGLSISAAILVGSFIGPLVGNLLVSFSNKVNVIHPGGSMYMNEVSEDAGDVTVQKMVDAATAIQSSEFAPIKFELAIFFFLWLFSIYVLPESRSEKARKKSRSTSISSSVESGATILLDSQQSWYAGIWKSINFLEPMKLLIIPDEFLTSIPPTKRNKRKVGVLMLILVDTSVSALQSVLGEICIMYAIYKFKWSQSELGEWIAVSCFANAFALVAFLPFLNSFVLQKLLSFKVLKKSFDMVDYGITMFGLSTDAVGLVLLYFATSTNTFMLTLVVSCFGPLVSPTLTSSITKFYPDSKIGELYGAIALTKNLLCLLTPIVFLSLYKFFISQWDKPELIFLVYSSLSLMLAVAVIAVKHILGLDENTVSALNRSNSMISFSGQYSIPSTIPSKAPSLTSSSSQDEDEEVFTIFSDSGESDNCQINRIESQ